MGSGPSGKLGPLGFTLLMFSMTACLPLFFLGPMAYGWGLSPGEALLASLAGNGVVAAAMVLNGLPGVRERIDFGEQARRAFGGLHKIPVALRGVVGGLWYGVEAYNGALALALIVLTLAGARSGLLERATVLVPVFLVLYVAAATAAFRLGIETVGRVASIAGPLLFLYFIALLASTPGGGSTPGGVPLSSPTFLTYLAIQTGWWLTVAINMSDLSRAARDARSVITGVLLGMVGGQLLGTYTGYLLAARSGAVLPQEIIVESGMSPPVVVLGLLFAFLAPWTTDLSANLPALESLIRSLTGMRWRTTSLVAGLLGLALAPWYAMDKAQDIVNYVAGFAANYGILLGPVLGAMIPPALGAKTSPKKLLAAITIGIIAEYAHATLTSTLQTLTIGPARIPFPPPIALYTGTITALTITLATKTSHN